MGFDLDQPESFRGADADAVRAYLRGLGWQRRPSRSGGGEVWEDPVHRGSQVRIMPGYRRRAERFKEHPYVVISRFGDRMYLPLSDETL